MYESAEEALNDFPEVTAEDVRAQEVVSDIVNIENAIRLLLLAEKRREEAAHAQAYYDDY